MDDMYFGSVGGKQIMRDYRFPAGYLYTHALNECLHNHPESSTRGILRYCRVEFAFDLSRYWFCLTGIKKEIYWRVYGLNADEYLEIYNGLRRALMETAAGHGWRADIFMVMKEDEKQIAVLMSPGAAADCSARALAEDMGRLVQRRYEEDLFKGDGRYCNVTALSEELHGFSDIRAGYLQVRALNDLSFFRMAPAVLTAEEVARTRNGADYPAVMEECFQLALAVDEGDEGQALKRLNGLFLTLLRGSDSLSLCRDALSFFKNMLQVRCTVFGAPEGLELDALCAVERYLKIEECAQALSPVLSALCAAVREKGPYPRAVVQAMYYVKTHYAQDISIQDVARYVNMNANYLSGLFRESAGLPLRDHLIKTRVEAAQELLSRDGAKVAEAAAAVGFTDAKYFARVFKRIAGRSPARYREEHRQDQT